MWAENSVFYQIYPLGFCGAPKENDGILINRIAKVKEWIPHLKKLNIDAIYFSTVFESDRHGYDTRDYKKIDIRLGSNQDFADVCRALKDNGIKVVLDGVFNHVGRGFWAFQDLCMYRENSHYKDWFHLDFGRNSVYKDGFWYEGWEGHFELVKLNLKNPEVVEYLFDCIYQWIKEFEISGLRLDVAYCLEADFMCRLRQFCDQLKPDFFLVGEILFGDYRRIMNQEMLHSATNYECYKGLWSSFNDLNLFEIEYACNRQFGQNGIYKEQHLLNFVDNHDVNRLASILKEEKHLPLVYALLFGMPGIPCLYYGSEWGILGEKNNGDDELRPEIMEPHWNSLTDWISNLAKLHREKKSLRYGSYKQLFLSNRQLVFIREYEGERIVVAVNADENECYISPHQGIGAVENLVSGDSVSLENGYHLPPFSAFFWQV
ncbi:cyclomaltodextrinase [Clostridiales bacterium COT073_COT-073]|nr:cyclomaltodextrinase [Clostridiales bacterium COT073_COT-073]